MSRLHASVQALLGLLARADLRDDAAVEDLLAESTARRQLDLSDLGPEEQAALLASRCTDLLPSPAAFAERVVRAHTAGRAFVAKFGIDPTGPEVHLGHAVPMILLSRVQRMGHRVVLIVGDLTARIGDPSGRSDERPPLSAEDIAANLASYEDQMRPFFDLASAEVRRNSEWLDQVTLPRLIEVTARLPVSMALQRDDFRQRLAAGQGLSLAELLYSVVMALDSVETRCDLEVGGIDQFLNLQMCRKVMELHGLEPELVATTPLLEGTDGSGAKMSKSRGNYVPLLAPPDEVFGKVMSIPDHLVRPWFEALSEWRDEELDLLTARLAAKEVRPVDVKRLLAGEVTAALHGLEAAMAARAEFAARFATRTYAQADLPVVSDLAAPLAASLRALGFAGSNGEIRRAAAQRGLRLVVEAEGGQEQVILETGDVLRPLADVLAERLGERLPAKAQLFVKLGRHLARVGQ
ncbi:tyrosine--tRNA ligase [Aciditerrimonas ferrireducens]|jgi:tyrosyl-tRNA synthetase|uniref:Tyrosine--tRNA ligase n=1 Tax=Aciditerrimonas ferrireducens TaxID=667306 RepID=A0ABV6C1P8_9ACTN|nr:tyrosine--tRNA ligase [Aciditerrimonas ferrireducens]MCK4177757.1 tyrosine--tRNA ligase [Aciditerrimonas ferrireducens]